MPKFLFRGTYSQEGLTLVQEKGGSSRREAGRALVESVGGRLESPLAGRTTHDDLTTCSLASPRR